jgi:hypothetical protein
MKTLSLALLMTTGLAFVLMGCSDNLNLVATPNDQALSTPTSTTNLGKVFASHFAGTDTPVKLLDPGSLKLVGGKWKLEGMVIEARLEVGNPLVTGKAVYDLNGTLDYNTGEGTVHGKFTVTPDAGVGVWEGTYEGLRIKTGESEWTGNFKEVGHGTGGTIQGMQFFAKEAVVSWDTPPTAFVGTVEGDVISH